MSTNVFQNVQLQRIADSLSGGGAEVTVNIDVTGAGDMQGATSGAAGVHGLVPAPAAGDQDKVLTGAGTWAEVSGAGGVDYSTTEQDTGIKWIDGSSIYQITLVISVAAFSGSIDYDVSPYVPPAADKIIKASCYSETTTGGYTINSNFTDFTRFYEQNGSYYLYIHPGGSDYWSVWTAYLTIQYTKI